jgi:hypothetical protein
MITAAMVGSKGLCDSFCTNAHYAKVGGLSKVELNLLEVEFLVRVDYRIVPKVPMLNNYYERMVSRLAGKYVFNIIEPDLQNSQMHESNIILPSEVAYQEKRENRSSVLKRRSDDDQDNNSAAASQVDLNHNNNNNSTTNETNPNETPKRTKSTNQFNS